MVHVELCPEGLRRGCPYEGLGSCWLRRCSGRWSFRVHRRTEDAPLQALPGEPGDQAFDGVEPQAQGRREVERLPRMRREPGQHLGVLVGGIVVESSVDALSSGTDRATV